jgi:uncharacterized protein (UPF0276 family)
MMHDRIGIGWRPELAAGVVLHLDEIDVVEVIADDYFDAGRQGLRALRTLAVQVPVLLHGVSLGLASTARVETARVERIARVVEAVRPEFWSEHLAFVRGGGREIGHLAAPPRTLSTIDGLAENVWRASALVGCSPVLENVATLVEPPGSCLDETAWLARAISATGSPLLLDLHNLYANAVNFGTDPFQMLAELPAEQIRAVHVAGGKWIARHTSSGSGRRLLDDHLHDVPEIVYDLLREVGRRVPQTISVILERDGEYPAMEHLLGEIRRLRLVLAEGRVGRDSVTERKAALTSITHNVETTAAFEAFLARIYVDADLRRLLLRAPSLTAAQAGLSPEESQALEHIDRVGMEFAAHSFARKRASTAHAQREGSGSLFSLLKRCLTRA